MVKIACGDLAHRMLVPTAICYKLNAMAIEGRKQMPIDAETVGRLCQQMLDAVLLSSHGGGTSGD